MGLALAMAECAAVQVSVFPKRGLSFKVEVEVTKSTTTSDVLETVRDIACDVDKPPSEGKWVLCEKWNGIGKARLLC